MENYLSDELCTEKKLENFVPEIESLYTVSYTHLDVYKRQEKRYRHAMAESTKLDNKINVLLQNKSELENFTKLSAHSTSSEYHLGEDSAIKAKLNEYADKNKILSDKLKELVETNAEKSKHNDELRLKYQVESSRAAESAQTVKNMQESMKSLENKVSGPLTKFSTESLKKELERCV